MVKITQNIDAIKPHCSSEFSYTYMLSRIDNVIKNIINLALDYLNRVEFDSRMMNAER